MVSTNSDRGGRPARLFFLRWWYQPDQFDWLTGYLRARGLGPPMRVLMTLISAALALMPVGLLFSAPRSPLVAAVASIIAVTTGLAYAVLWCRRWPSRVQSLSMALVGGCLIAVGSLLHADPVIALMGCTGLAVTGGYLAFFHNSKAIALNVALAVISGALCAARMTQSHTLAVTAVGLWLILELNVAFPLAIQAVVRTLGADVVRSDHDPVTGLLNRRAFYERATTLLTTPCADLHLLVVMIDLDNFKMVNDNYGHIAGDQVLASVGWALRRASATAIVGRFGGEEFIVIDALPNDAAHALPPRLCAAIAELPQPVTASVGAAVVRWSGVEDPASAMESLIRAADTAMYNAKHGGGNQTSFCTPILA